MNHLFLSNVHCEYVVLVSVVLLKSEDPILQRVEPRALVAPLELDRVQLAQGPDDLLEQVYQAKLLDHLVERLGFGLRDLRGIR